MSGMPMATASTTDLIMAYLTSPPGAITLRPSSARIISAPEFPSWKHSKLAIKLPPLKKKKDVRLSGNPVADIGKGGIPRFVFIARLRKVKIFNGSEISPRERKDSEIRYVRMVMSKCHGSPEEIRRFHPRLFFVGKLKNSCESFVQVKIGEARLVSPRRGFSLTYIVKSLMELGIGNESTVLVDEEP